MSTKPIGIFDSGAGGLSIWKEISELLPYESTLYISDAKYAPYGTKGKKAILKRSIINTEILLNKGAKIVVVACNTATTNAISFLREKYNVPFIGIEPAIKPAALNTKTNCIGILATQGTLSSALFHETSQLYTKDLNVIEQVGNGIVELIEAGALFSIEMEQLLKSYLSPMLDANMDCLVLGCTHYHFLKPILEKILPKNIKIIDSGLAVAKQTKAVLQKHNLIIESTQQGEHAFYTNGSKEVISSLMNWDKAMIHKLD
ncbi:MAG: glutamate racemase [Flavobacteriaceae bacterium]